MPSCSAALPRRDEISRAALDKLMEKAKFKIFDVNLAQTHYDTDRLLTTMKRADMLKLNDDELYELSAIYGSPYHSIEQNIAYLNRLTGAQNHLRHLRRTRRNFIQDGELYRHCGFRIKVADTVGSGDSFLAGLTYKLLNNAEPQEAITFACALGALVASRHGATPDISLQEIESFMNPGLMFAIKGCHNQRSSENGFSVFRRPFISPIHFSEYRLVLSRFFQAVYQTVTNCSKSVFLRHCPPQSANQPSSAR